MSSARKRTATKRSEAHLAAEKLDKMIEEATVDAYNASEQTVGFYTMMEDNPAMPFKTELLGVEVTIERVDMTDDEVIVAVCRCGKSCQRIPILDLPLPDPLPKGAEWISAYRRWAGEGR